MSDIMSLDEFNGDDITVRFRISEDGRNILIETIHLPDRYRVKSLQSSSERFFIEQVERVIKMIRTG